MAIPLSRCAALWAASLCLALPRSQDPVTPREPRPGIQPAAAGETMLEVHIRCEAVGKHAVRPWLAAAAPDRQSHAWEEREVSWRVGEDEFEERADLQQALKRVYNDRAMWQADRRNPGQKKPMPIRIVPGEDVRWAEVVAAFDIVASVGLQEIQLGDVASRYYTMAAVPEPFPLGRSVVAPAAQYCVPVEFGEGEFWPQVVLAQDGTVHVEGERIVKPVAANDAAEGEARRVALREQLARWRAEAERLGRVQGPQGREHNDALFVLTADRWTPWPEIERLLAEANGRGVGFDRFLLGVAEVGMDPAVLPAPRKGG